MLNSILFTLTLTILIASCSNSEDKSNSVSKENNSDSLKNTPPIQAIVEKDRTIHVLGYDIRLAISKDQLSQESLYNLRIVRNSIFAKYGYQFSSYDLSKYFSSLEWYSPKDVDLSSVLTGVDKQNVVAIKNIEKNIIDRNYNLLESIKATCIDSICFKVVKVKKYIEILGDPDITIVENEDEWSPFGQLHYWLSEKDGMKIVLWEDNYTDSISYENNCGAVMIFPPKGMVLQTPFWSIELGGPRLETLGNLRSLKSRPNWDSVSVFNERHFLDKVMNTNAYSHYSTSTHYLDNAGNSGSMVPESSDLLSQDVEYYFYSSSGRTVTDFPNICIDIGVNPTTSSTVYLILSSIDLNRSRAG